RPRPRGARRRLPGRAGAAPPRRRSACPSPSPPPSFVRTRRTRRPRELRSRAAWGADRPSLPAVSVPLRVRLEDDVLRQLVRLLGRQILRRLQLVRLAFAGLAGSLVLAHRFHLPPRSAARSD